MSFISILKTVGQVGLATLPTTLNLVSPGVGTVASVVLNAIMQAQATHGTGGGDTKLTTALQIIQASTPALVSTITQSTGKTLSNQSLFAQGIQEITQGVVDLLNAFSLLPTSTDPTAGLSTTSPTSQTIVTPTTTVTVATK